MVGEPPTNKGYPPSVFSQLPKLVERGGMGDADGSITSIYTVLAEFELGNDPIVELARATLGWADNAVEGFGRRGISGD